MYNVRCTSCKKQLETQCTNYKKFEKQMYKFGNNIYKCRGKCGNTMYKPKEIWKHDEQIQRKSRKNNVQFEGKFGNNIYRFKDTCANTRYKFQREFGREQCKKRERNIWRNNCSVYNVQLTGKLGNTMYT